MSDYVIQFADWCEFPPETMAGETVFDGEGNAIGWIVNATMGRRDTMELWPEWEQVLFANVSDEVAQDNLNECVHELLDKAATVERSCASCPEMDNPDSYISHLQSALKWYDEHVPRPTHPMSTCVVLEGKKIPEEVLFIGPNGVTHYLPEVTCKDLGGTGANGEDVFNCSECGCVLSLYDGEGANTLCTSFIHDYPRFCPECGARVVSE